jgi:hypothetical protein
MSPTFHRRFMGDLLRQMLLHGMESATVGGISRTTGTTSRRLKRIGNQHVVLSRGLRSCTSLL